MFVTLSFNVNLSKGLIARKEVKPPLLIAAVLKEIHMKNTYWKRALSIGAFTMIMFTGAAYACQGCSITCPNASPGAPVSCSENGNKCQGFTTCPVVICSCNGSGGAVCTKTC